MTPFHYQDHHLHAEDVPLAAIAAAVGTPVYVYSSAALVDAFRSYADAFAGLPVTVCYAVKANDSLAVLRLLAGEGAGADVVSGGELRYALAAGIPAERIVFSGVGKTREELAFALAEGVMQINVEVASELDVLSELATAMGRTARVAIRINPDVDAGTIAQISTGKAENKFGIAYDAAPALFRHAQALPGVEPVGLAVHIGSQITRLEPYRDAFHRVRDLYCGLRDEGLPLERIDLGGGLGITYRDEAPPAVAAYAQAVREVFHGLDARFVLEPGRRIAGPAGVLVTRVITEKRTAAKRFVIVDAAMNDLIRPALYDAYHPIQPETAPPPEADWSEADLVGPICESTDRFAAGRTLPPLAPDAMLVIGAAGAYGAVMACEYNGRPRVPEVLVRGGDWSVVRRRPTYEEMIAAQTLPPWLEEA
ncbi:MAG: diaminopimelate decarboxylase [Alphaproteobacteria bacterium]|nr:diaminopimelate decarboxylase [Alphaproteobacteria bacterium]MCB9927868.1 diaminopimelate decarboxylase [Alphaproteobacteria bacterium]